MTISAELLRILADPETHEPVALASDGQLGELRERIRAGKAKVRGGGDAPAEFEAALLSQKNRVVYLVIEGVPNFLVDDRLELDEPL